MSRVIAIIGTAGRDKNIQLTDAHWTYMTTVIFQEIKPEDILVSGGAAWADHVAIWAFLNNLCAGLILHLPAPFEGNRFIGEYGTSGNACNYYHKKFCSQLGINSFDHIKQALAHKNCKVTTQPVTMGYAAMANRNKLVANDCTHMIAFTFGEGDVPADGGTKITWDMAADKQRIHIPIIH